MSRRRSRGLHVSFELEASRPKGPPEEKPRDPGSRLDRLALRRVKAENEFYVHLATWGGGVVFFTFLNVITGGPMPWALFPILGWGIGVFTHGFTTMVAKPRKWAAKEQILKEEIQRQQAEREAEGAHALRRRLLESAEVARETLRSVSPQAASDVARGETRALAVVAWLDEAERIAAERQRQQRLRKEVATKLSEPGFRSVQNRLVRQLEAIDAQDARLAQLEAAIEDRRERLDSFLLALQSVRAAGSGRLSLPAATAFSERVALLDAPAAEAEDDPQSRIQQEVQLAQELQQSIMPQRAPDVPGLRLAHVYRPCSEVGGDFYDFYQPQPEQLLVALGDASGHGIDSSMVSSMAKSALYMQVGAGRDLGTALAEINQMMCDTLGRRRMMTLALLLVDTAARTIRFVNAGQIYPVLYRDGRAAELELPGYPLGVRRDLTYSERQVDLRPGDRLVLLTDGFVEAPNADGDPFGFSRLLRRIEASPNASVDDLIDGLASDLSEHLGPLPPEDDVTLLALEYEP